MTRPLEAIVSEAIRLTPMRVTDDGLVMQASEVEKMLSDAIQAGQQARVDAIVDDLKYLLTKVRGGGSLGEGQRRGIRRAMAVVRGPGL